MKPPAAVATFTDIIRSRSARVVALGKEAFYAQVDAGIEAAYELTGTVMASNVLEPDTQEGIDAFLQKRSPNW